MNIVSTNTPLLRHEPVIHGAARQLDDAPSPGRLVRLARSHKGGLLGSHTTKYFAGVLIGIGLMLSPAGGVGLGLVIAGSALWLTCTAISTAALNDKSLKSVYRHVGHSVLSGSIGVGLGVASVPLAALSAATQPIMGIWVSAFMIITSAIVPYGMDKTDARNESRIAAEIRARAAATLLQNNILTILNTLFRSNEKITIQQQNDDGDAVAIEINMEARQDKLTCAAIEGSDREWIAVERAPNCYDLFEASSFYNDANLLRYTHHPYIRLPMDQVRILRGQPLLNLLSLARPGPTELTDFSLTHDVDDGTQPAAISD